MSELSFGILPQVPSSVSSFVPNFDDKNAGSALLVPIAKFASPPADFDEMFMRFYLQSEARRLLRSRAENDKDERVCDCLRKIVPGAGGVAVMFSTKLQRAHYKNLLVCGRVW